MIHQVAGVGFGFAAVLLLAGAGLEFRNVSGSPVVRRYLALALLCILLAVMLYIDPLQYLKQGLPHS